MTSELSKLKSKKCDIISKRVSYILSVAPDVTTLEEAQKNCAMASKPAEDKNKITGTEIITAKIPQPEIRADPGCFEKHSHRKKEHHH